MKTIVWFLASLAVSILLLVGSFVVGAHAIALAPVVPFVSEPEPVTILAFGDMMLDRAVRKKIDEVGVEYLFEKVTNLLSAHDVVVVNAEGVFTANESISAQDNTILRFTFATSTLPVLRSLGFSVFSHANNHALDFGHGGLAFSKNLIESAGGLVFGDPLNKEPGPLYLKVRDELIAFVGYHQLFTPDASTTLAAIAKAKEQNAFTIVYPHWGDEYNLGTTSLQTKLAHAFIDAGADAVVGAHPHVIEPVEQYNGKIIFYSLGNFIFDQKWNEDVRRGFAVNISLTKREATYTLIPYLITDLQPEPTGEVSTIVLER